ncbi:hypothetical protein A1D29_11250 [Pasteurellaceae bacterium Orientalotternb1]|nr:hypothetical protein A1D29_11250 [Pasteurellaceae bacterium Orientalotternb1]
MKSLKSFLTLGIAMAISSATFAETTTPNMMLKDSATQTVETGKQAVTSVKNSAKTASEKMAGAKDSAQKTMTEPKQAVTSAKSAASEKVKEVKESVTKTKEQALATKEKAKKTAKVNINTADAKTLQTLNGIGEAKAQAIIDYRTKNGKIKDLKELANVSGIGEATLEKLKGAVSF